MHEGGVAAIITLQRGNSGVVLAGDAGKSLAAANFMQNLAFSGGLLHATWVGAAVFGPFSSTNEGLLPASHERQVNADRASGSQAIAPDVVPGAYFLRGDTEILGHRNDGVAAAGTVADSMFGIEVARFPSYYLSRCNRDDELSVGLNLFSWQSVGFGYGGSRSAVSAGQAGQRFPGSYAVVAPPDAHVFRDGCNGGLVAILGAQRQVQLEFCVLGSGGAKEAGV